MSIEQARLSVLFYFGAEELGYGEDEGEEEARQERLRMAQEAASSGSSFPDPEERGYFLSDLFGKAAYIDVAVIMELGTRMGGREAA